MIYIIMFLGKVVVQLITVYQVKQKLKVKL